MCLSECVCRNVCVRVRACACDYSCILGDGGTGKSVIGGILKDFVPANMFAALSQNAQARIAKTTT